MEQEERDALGRGEHPTPKRRKTTDPYKKNVVVLLESDVRCVNDQVLRPIYMDMARIRKPDKGQFKSNIEFTTEMTEMQVKERLLHEFPILRPCTRLSCASAKDNRTMLDFHAESQHRGLWNGAMIKKHLKGNSALYVFGETSESGRIPTRLGDPTVAYLGPTSSGSVLPASERLKLMSRKSYPSGSPVSLRSSPNQIEQGNGILQVDSSQQRTDQQPISLEAPVIWSRVPETTPPLSYVGQATKEQQRTREDQSNRPKVVSEISVHADLLPGSQCGLHSSVLVSSQSQIGQGQITSTCLGNNTVGDQISQNAQTSGASLTEPGILQNDPLQQIALTADQQPTSHMSDSGRDSIRSNALGLAVASDPAEQSGDISAPSEIFDLSEDIDSILEEGSEVMFECLTQSSGVVKEIIPSQGCTETDIRFCILLDQKLPRKYKGLSFQANFANIATVPLKRDGRVLTGNIISSLAGKVKVTLEYKGSNGKSIGFTYFEFTKNSQRVILEEISKVRMSQDAMYKTVNSLAVSRSSGVQQETPRGARGTGVGSSNMNKRNDALPEEILTLLVYKAAEIEGREFLEMVFSTSVGRVLFNHYRNNLTLPEDVARANGHTILGDFLEDVNERLSKEVCRGDNYETIDWLELKYAVDKKICLPSTNDAQAVSSPVDDVNQSGYEADDEASSLPSPADTNANGSEMHDSEHGDIEQITSGKDDSRDSITTETERRRHQKRNERQAGSGSSFANRDDSEKEMESLPYGTDIVEIKVKACMAAAQEYTNEQLNYFRVCYLTIDIITEGLRTIFKQEWDGRYKRTLGEWKDEPQNGLHFKNSESPRKQREKNRLLATMVNGNRAEWDCTMLFYAILFSDCIGNGLNPTIRSKVDDLRKFRNEEFAHMPHGNLTDAEFQNAINKVDVAFQALGLSMDQIEEIQNQASFPTDELKNVLKRVEDLKQEVEVLEAQLKDISAFCVLPPKPTHEVADRDLEVTKIVKHLKDLKEANKNRLTYGYITGNPGSGKSQLAGLVAKRFFDQVDEIPHSLSFVMTVNAESPNTLLESYVSFARKLKCPEYVISNTLNFPDLSSDEKISHLKTLIGTKIELYTSWLLVVDNVRSISNIYAHLPESADEQWTRGQLLITTQDIASVPSTSCFIYHVSVSKGMELQDARSLIEKLSGISDCETDKVALVLDYQPLALAIAATYIRDALQNNENFGWKNYIQRLDKGQGVATARIFVETNPTNPKSMNEVSEIAVEEVMKSSNAVLKHTLTLLSFCAAQPLSLEIVVNYIRNVEIDMLDEDDIRMKIRRCPLLLFDENESGVYIRVHQVTHDAISNVVGGHTQGREIIALKVIVKSLFQFVKEYKLNDPDDLNSVVKGTRIVPHLQMLVRTIRQKYSKKNASEVAENDSFHTSTVLHFNTLALTCVRYCAHVEAKEYYELLGSIMVKNLGPEHVDVARMDNNLGIVHLDLDELDQAKVLYDRAVPALLEKLGPEHVDVASTYQNLGNKHLKLGELSQAKECYDRTLAIRLKKLGPEHVDVAKAYQSLGNVYLHLGELSLTKQFYDRALAILKRLGLEHVDITSTYQNLGIVHHNLGELSQAKEFYDRALAIRLKKLGPHHVDVAKTCHQQGKMHFDLGELSRAKEFYDRALAILLKILGPEHVDVAIMYENLGNIQLNLGELSQAKEFYDRALALRLKKLGPEHVDVAKTYINLGNVHLDLGELNQAKEFYDRAVAILLKKLGPDNVDVANAYEYLGNMHCTLGELSPARVL